MRKRTVRLSAVLLSALLVAMLAACGGNAKKDENASPSGSVSPGPTASASVSQATAKEPVILKIYSQQAFPGQFPSGVQMDEVSQEIERITGVKLEWDMQPTDDKTKAMLASGDIPDILILNGPTFISDLVKSGFVAPLDDLLGSNGKEIAKTAPKAIDYSKKSLSGDSGGLYFIPGRVSGKDSYFSPVIGLHMRWDYYKELGFPELKTADDVVNAAAEMQKKHPTTAEGKKVYAFSPWTDWGVWHYSVLHDNAFGQSGYVDLASGSMGYDKEYNFIDRIQDDRSSYWTDAELYNKAFRKGLLDPDSFTQKYDEAMAKMDAGRVLVQIAQWLTDKPNATLQQEGKADAGYVSIPWSGGSYTAGNYNPIGLASYWSISKNSKYPDRAMDVINYFFSEEGSRTILSGVKGKYWTEENGKAKLTEAGLKVKQDPDFMNTTGIRKFQNLTGIDMMGKDSKGQYIDLFLEPDVVAQTLTPVKKEWLDHYGVASEDELWKKNGGYAANTAFRALLPTPSDDVKRLDAKIDSYLRTALPKLIMSKNEEAFQSNKTKIRDDIKKLNGYDQMVESVKKAVEDSKVKVQAYE